MREGGGLHLYAKKSALRLLAASQTPIFFSFFSIWLHFWLQQAFQCPLKEIVCDSVGTILCLILRIKNSIEVQILSLYLTTYELKCYNNFKILREEVHQIIVDDVFVFFEHCSILSFIEILVIVHKVYNTLACLQFKQFSLAYLRGAAFRLRLNDDWQKQ